MTFSTDINAMLQSLKANLEPSSTAAVSTSVASSSSGGSIVVVIVSNDADGSKDKRWHQTRKHIFRMVALDQR
jgi:hypothetical protein